ncbi:hypothetical protein HPB47_008198 [Ixodes persulcatus]|uniref:Uncharacterized protein n=1 Tax=Ixodes persulcatus TaxID=34615 RepID=A0AC60P679_IXOPE|nr:hypothetical protein HPB47_008198 [Ixodes persulcatus]
MIVAAAVDDPILTAKEIRNELGLSVSTIRERLHEAGLRSGVPARKPMVSANSRHKRLLFAQEHSSWTVADWKNVVFTDESAFTTRWDKRQRIWRADRTRFNPVNFQRVASSGRCSVSVWGALSKDGLGHLVRLDGRFNAARYMDVAETVLLPYVMDGPFSDGYFYLQQDRSPIHMARNRDAHGSNSFREPVPPRATVPKKQAKQRLSPAGDGERVQGCLVPGQRPAGEGGVRRPGWRYSHFLSTRGRFASYRCGYLERTCLLQNGELQFGVGRLQHRSSAIVFSAFKEMVVGVGLLAAKPGRRAKAGYEVYRSPFHPRHPQGKLSCRGVCSKAISQTGLELLVYDDVVFSRVKHLASLIGRTRDDPLGQPEDWQDLRPAEAGLLNVAVRGQRQPTCLLLVSPEIQ